MGTWGLYYSYNENLPRTVLAAPHGAQVTVTQSH